MIVKSVNYCKITNVIEFKEEDSSKTKTLKLSTDVIIDDKGASMKKEIFGMTFTFDCSFLLCKNIAEDTSSMSFKYIEDEEDLDKAIIESLELLGICVICNAHFL